MHFLRVAAAAAMALGVVSSPGAKAQSSSDILGSIRSRGHLVCGTGGNVPGFSYPDSQGVMRGLDADTCRSVAAAIFGDPSKIRFVATTGLTRFPALQSGEIDMLVRSTTWTLTREAALGLEFASVNFYDGQGFIVKKSLNVSSARELDGASVCVQPGSTTEANLADYFRANNMRLNPVVLENVEQVRDAFNAGRCDAYTHDTSSLAAFRFSLGEAGGELVVLPEIISKEPIGAFVRKGDQRFFDVVRWTHFAMLTAEELGITSANVATFQANPAPDVQRFMGRSGDLGKVLGLSPDWAIQVVRGVGNFSEMWERNMTPLGVPRGINALWHRGGIQYAPPMR